MLARLSLGKEAEMISFRWLACAGLLAAGSAFLSQAVADDPPSGSSRAAQTALRQGRELLRQDDLANALLLLESQLKAGQADADYRAALAEAYERQIDRLRREGNLQKAAELWDKLGQLQGGGNKTKAPEPSSPTATPSQGGPRNSAATPPPPASIKEERKGSSEPNPSDIDAAEQAFGSGQYTQAGEFYQRAQRAGENLSVQAKERYAYCKLVSVAKKLNAAAGQTGADQPKLEREVREALDLAPRLVFGQELLQRLQSLAMPRTAAVRHRQENENGWQISETEHFKAFHLDNRLAEDVLQTAELTRAAVARKWLGREVAWTQPCLIHIFPTAESYHRHSGMPASAPGHSDYDSDRMDASIIHVRRVFVRADHPHMLTAILPHEVTHVVLNGQVGRKLLPRWADEGMAVLSEPFSRIAMHIDPLPRAYEEGRTLSLAELLRTEAYPSDRSKVAAFYGQSVCLVEYLTTLRGPQTFTAFLRDAGQQGEEASLQKHYGLGLSALETGLRQWIISEGMPTLRQNGHVLTGAAEPRP
jgi:tetratricopeptide (TPR) repeat protein